MNRICLRIWSCRPRRKGHDNEHLPPCCLDVVIQSIELNSLLCIKSEAPWNRSILIFNQAKQYKNYQPIWCMFILQFSQQKQSENTKELLTASHLRCTIIFPLPLFSPAQQRLNALSFITYYLVMLHIIVFFLIAANLDFKRLLYDVNSFFFRRLINERGKKRRRKKLTAFNLNESKSRWKINNYIWYNY